MKYVGSRYVRQTARTADGAASRCPVQVMYMPSTVGEVESGDGGLFVSLSILLLSLFYSCPSQFPRSARRTIAVLASS